MRSTQEQHLFARIVVLTFLLGLVFGPTGWFIGIRAYNFIRSGFDPLADPPFSWPLDAFQIILGGAFMVLLLTVLDLCSQFLMGLQWKDNRRAFFRFCEHFSKIVAFLLVGEGFVSLVEKPLSGLYPKQELGVDIFLTLLVPLCIGGLSWYLFVRGKRRSGQQIAREKAMKER